MITFTNDIDIRNNNLYVGASGPMDTLEDLKVVNRKYMQEYVINASSSGILGANNTWSGINTFTNQLNAAEINIIVTIAQKKLDWL